MSTKLRFRPRQGERKVEDSLIRKRQAAVDAASSYLRGLFSRYTSHLVIVTVAVLVFAIGPINFHFEYDFPLPATPTAVPALGFRLNSSSLSGRGGPRDLLDDESMDMPETVASWTPAREVSPSTSDLVQAPVFHTTIPKRLRREVITYVVEAGDNVGKIALKFSLDPETVVWANGNLAHNPNLLRPGQELFILPIDGVYHTVNKGDTLSSIAKKYKAEVQNIVECPYNQLDQENPVIVAGDRLIVPGGMMPYTPYIVSAYKGPIPADAAKGTGVFGWPASGRPTDRYGYKTQSGRWHNGVDISNSSGTAIYAADSGFVVVAGWQNNGYGNLIVIDHRNGYVSYYAHLSGLYVSAGQSVSKGTMIGLMGSTGNSSGPHLHFELRYKDVRQDPEQYLTTQ